MSLIKLLGAVGCALILSACETLPSSTGVNVSAIDPRTSVAVELHSFVDQLPTHDLNPALLAEMRAARLLPDDMPGISNVTIDGINGAPPIRLFIVDPLPDAKDKPVYLHMHGGGYVLGYSQLHLKQLPITAAACACLVVSVDYRLAPETTFPGPMEDNLAALLWVRSNAAELGIDVNRIAIGGESAGGGHAAQLSIAARDQGIPIDFQVLVYPMLDDRTGSTVPVPEPIGHYLWTAGSNEFAWTSYLGQPAGSENPPYGAVPARVEDLSALPPAWIGTGDIDLFYQESLDYAERLEAAGVPVELYIAAGAFHGFRSIAPDTEITRNFEQSWMNALGRALRE